jgi:hypothetical protein
MGWEIMNHHPHNPDLASSDFHLFGPMKVYLGGQKFQTDDELLNWLCGQDKTLYGVGISNLLGWWK